MVKMCERCVACVRACVRAAVLPFAAAHHHPPFPPSDLAPQSINALMRRSLDMIIGCFEAEDVTSVIALENMLESSRLTHQFLSEDFTIDPFDDMLQGQQRAGWG